MLSIKRADLSKGNRAESFREVCLYGVKMLLR